MPTGYAAHYFKKRNQLRYGVVEVLAGIATAIGATAKTEFQPSQGLAILGAIYVVAPGTLTFRWYDIGPEVSNGKRRELVYEAQFTTTVEQIAYAFLSPGNMPPEGSYAKAIRLKLKSVME